MLTDTAKTITVTHTFTASQAFNGGWTAGAACTVSTGGLTITAGGLTVTAGGITVAAGTAAFQAVTATTVNGQTISSTAQFTGSLNVAGAVILGGTVTVQGNFTAQLAFTANTITVTAGDIRSTRPGPFTLFSVGAEVLRLGTNSAWRWEVGTDGHLVPFTTYNLGASGGRVGTVYATTLNTVALTASGTVTFSDGMTVSSGTTALQALTATTGSFSSTLAAGNTTITGTMLVSSTINGQTISSGAAFSGTLSVAGETRVGPANALSSSATSGFFWFSTMNGNPSGNPVDTDQRAAAVYNYANNTLHIRNPFDDTWRSVALT